MSAKFSHLKMQEIRKSKCYTYENLAEITGIPRSTITKVFGGFQTNPTMIFLTKMAEALNCGIDDFFIWNEEPTSPYYLDRKTGELAQEIHDNPDLRILLDASRDLSPEDLKTVITIAQKIKGNTNG